LSPLERIKCKSHSPAISAGLFFCAACERKQHSGRDPLEIGRKIEILRLPSNLKSEHSAGCLGQRPSSVNSLGRCPRHPLEHAFFVRCSNINQRHNVADTLWNSYGPMLIDTTTNC